MGAGAATRYVFRNIAALTKLGASKAVILAARISVFGPLIRRRFRLTFAFK